MSLPRKRTVSPAGLRRDQLRIARESAPTLHDCVPSASQVRVELTFSADHRIAQSSQVFMVFPSAQAHFVYACPFGSCDGTFELNEKVFGMLRAHTTHATGVLSCNGQRAHQTGPGPVCGLAAKYDVTATYETDRPGPAVKSAPSS